MFASCHLTVLLRGKGLRVDYHKATQPLTRRFRSPGCRCDPPQSVLFYVRIKVGQFAAIRSSIKLRQTRLSNCNAFCNLSQTKRSSDAFGSTFLMCDIAFASICGLNRNGLQPPPPDSKRMRSYESRLLIQIHADVRHAGINSTKYAKVHTGLILEGSRYAATLLEDE